MSDDADTSFRTIEDWKRIAEMRRERQVALEAELSEVQEERNVLEMKLVEVCEAGKAVEAARLGCEAVEMAWHYKEIEAADRVLENAERRFEKALAAASLVKTPSDFRAIFLAEGEKIGLELAASLISEWVESRDDSKCPLSVAEAKTLQKALTVLGNKVALTVLGNKVASRTP